MTAPLSRLNDGSNRPPRLRIHHSLWSLIRLPMNSSHEWSLDQKFAHAVEAGFEAVECWLNDENEREHLEALQKHGLRLVLGHHPHSLEDVVKEAKRVKRLGADFLFAQPLTPYAPIPEASQFLREASKIVEGEAGVPYFIETHRNNMPESLNQALTLIDAMPEITLTGDFSHFVVVGEFYGWTEERAIDRMAPVLKRVSHLHARISNGEQVQVDVGDGSGQTAQFFVQIWAAAMRYWLEEAQPGDIFPFASELGPPRYAITLPDGSEFSDRWQQSLVMKRLGEQAWNLANE